MYCAVRCVSSALVDSGFAAVSMVLLLFVCFICCVMFVLCFSIWFLVFGVNQFLSHTIVPEPSLYCFVVGSASC